MQVSIRPVRAAMIPRPMLVLLLVALLTVALAAIAVLALNRGPRLPAPFGPAANGLIAYDRGGQIFLARSDGSSPRPLSLGSGEAFTPTFSPDGTRLAFLSRATPDARIHLTVANADGTASRSRAPTISIVHERLFHPQWSPDGRRLAVSTMLGAEYRIVVVDVETGTPTILPGTGDDWYPSWSPDGQWILFRRYDPSTVGIGIGIMRPDGSDVRILTSRADISAAFTWPTWAPGGTRVAFWGGTENAFDIGTVDLNGVVTLVSAESENETDVAWSPDGATLAFFGAASGLVVVNADGSDRRAIGGPDCGLVRTGQDLAWSPDGTALAYTGSECRMLTRIPLADPAAATPILQLGDEDHNGVSWQRLAP